MAQFEIRNDRPLPAFAPQRRPSTSPYPFDDMISVGQYFEVPYEVYKTTEGAETNSYRRLRGVVNQRNARQPRKTFNLELDEANKLVRVFLVAVNPDAPMPAPKPRTATKPTEPVEPVEPAEVNEPAPLPEALRSV